MTEEKEEKSSFSLEIDEQGMPVLNVSEPSWLTSFFTAAVYYIRRLFKSRKEKEDEDHAVSQFTAFLLRLRTKVEFEPLTGLPTFSIEIGESPHIGRKRHKKKRKVYHHRPAKKSKKMMTRKCRHRDTGYIEDEEKAPVVVESKHGTVIYHIHHLVVNITAEVVTQLNTNPQQVINVIQDQLRTELNKIEIQEPET